MWSISWQRKWAMNDSAQAAIKLLHHNLELIKATASTRGRLNLKQQAEEAIALLRIIERNQDDH